MFEDEPPLVIRKSRLYDPLKAGALGSLDRLPPHSEDAEKGVLGCILLDPNQSLDKCQEKLTDSAAFYDLRHRALYEHLLAMHAARQPIDLITLSERLGRGTLLEEIGGIVYLSGLQDAVPSAVNLEYYLGIVCDKFTLRKMLDTASRLIGRVHEHEGETDQIVEEFEREALAIRHDAVTTDKTSKAVMGDLINDLQQEAQGIYKAVVKTGIADFDKHYIGFSPGDMVLIAARPSVGKTAYMLQLALNMAAETPVGICSLEMTHESLCRRQLASLSAFDLRQIAHAKPDEQRRIAIAASKVAKLPIVVCDRAAMTIGQIAAKARSWVSKHGIKVLFVDYLQLARGSSKRAREDRRLEVAEVAEGLKAIAKELGLIVIALSQLNRKLEERGKDSKPRMSDLREAGELEQTADWILFLWAGRSDDDDEKPVEQSLPEARKITNTVAKNRNGPTGDVAQLFDKPTGRFLPITQFDNY
jgi:replicative DNA helicase